MKDLAKQLKKKQPTCILHKSMQKSSSIWAERFFFFIVLILFLFFHHFHIYFSSSVSLPLINLINFLSSVFFFALVVVFYSRTGCCFLFFYNYFCKYIFNHLKRFNKLEKILRFSFKFSQEVQLLMFVG
jgi:hypothetical protein